MAKRSIGVPTEVKDGERRIALDPVHVAALVQAGHRVCVQQGAGLGAGFADADYEQAGASLVADAADVWTADLIVKVKEPQPSEYSYLRPGLLLFAYLHLAAAPRLAAAIAQARVRAYAFETLTSGGALPLLAPMSEIAGRVAPIVGAYLLSSAAGGAGTLLGGAAGVPPAKVVVIGLGVAGTMAARGARGLDAWVVGVDVDLERLRAARLDGVVDATLASSHDTIGDAIADADLVVGAALVPGARAPIVVRREQVAAMRPGSVIVDLAIDQGGCVATSEVTSMSNPTYERGGVLHYCVPNVPAQYPRTASRALAAAVTPRLLRLAENPEDPALSSALNVTDGRIVHPEVAAALAAIDSGGASR